MRFSDKINDSRLTPGTDHYQTFAVKSMDLTSDIGFMAGRISICHTGDASGA